MDKELIQQSFDKMRRFFDEGKTHSYEFRIQCLLKLLEAIKKREKEISDAIKEDFHKPEFEVYGTELAVVYGEINYAIKHLKSWMKPKKVLTPLVIQPSTGKIYPEPRGLVLII